MGCTNCGLVLEAPTDLGAGHLTTDPCADCGMSLRIVNLEEANQLTRERFLTAHWKEIAISKGHRRRRTPQIR